MSEMSWAILAEGARPKRMHWEDTVHHGRGLLFSARCSRGVIGILASSSMLT